MYPLNKEDFLVWLEGLPEDKQMPLYVRSEQCPIACWIKDSQGIQVGVSSCSWVELSSMAPTQAYEMPHWASCFVRAFDRASVQGRKSHWTPREVKPLLEGN